MCVVLRRVMSCRWLRSFSSEIATAVRDGSELLLAGADVSGPVESLDQRCDWYRTLVQPDGDICVSVDAKALDSPHLEEDLRRHIEHVHVRLRVLSSVHRMIRILPIAVTLASVLATTLKVIFNLAVHERSLVGLVFGDAVVVWGLIIAVATAVLRLVGPWIAAAGVRFVILRRLSGFTAG